MQVPDDSGAAADTGASADSGCSTNCGDSGGGGSDAAGPNDAGSATKTCTDYCATFSAQCDFSTTTTDSFPSLKVCLAMCATMPSTGVTVDSVACRSKYIADGGDCPAGGPFAADNDTGTYCGSAEPCTALCRALSPRCMAAGSNIGDCATTCADNATAGGNPAVTCMEQATLDAYSTENATDIATYCQAFTTCPN